MKISVTLAMCLGVLVNAKPEPPSHQYRGGYSRGGFGGGEDYEDANYNFMYEVKDAGYGVDFGHQESRRGDVAQGNYHVLLPDGRVQTVDYTADQGGYRSMVNYQGGGGGVGGSWRGGAGAGAGRYRRGGYQGGFGGGRHGGGYQGGFYGGH